MIDTHYDLLTIAYLCYLKNDYRILKEISTDIKTSGVKWIFANLYFMSEEEMVKELSKNYYDKNVSILEMFKISKKILNEYISGINFIYSIEGCDYLNIDDLDALYDEGLNSIILVWNNKNKYGSGNRNDTGLTEEGRLFLNKAIELGIGIDLSHANKKTFFDMIDVIKDNIKLMHKVICYASHSNVRRLCNRDRNLTDKQIIALKEVNGLIGIFSNKNFVTLEHKNFKEEYLKHIIYIAELIGIENVMLSTDDMKFLGDIDAYYSNSSIFNYNNITKEIKVLLTKYFSVNNINKIMFDNCYQKIIMNLVLY